MALAGSQRAQLLIARERDQAEESKPSRPRPGASPSGAAAARSAACSVSSERRAPRVEADLARAVSVTLQRSSRPGLLVVLSDFLDPGPVTRALTQARAAGHEVVVIRVLSEEELAPRFEGDFSLEDAETGASVEVAVDAAALEARARLAGLLEELRAWARRHGAAYVRARTDENLEGVVRRVVSRAID